MSIDKLKLYNGALRLCGEGRTSLTEDRESRRLLDSIWDEGAVRYCLEQGQWSFATRTVKLEYINEISGSDGFGYRYQFEKPDDYIRFAAISTDEYFYNQLNQYADEANYFFADVDELYIKIISDDSSYGGNMALWSMSFAKYVQAYMAFEVSPRLTGVKVDMEKLERVMNKRLSEAQNQDGINRPTRFPNRGVWAGSRHSNNITNGRVSERWR